jgi:hypothetical protein
MVENVAPGQLFSGTTPDFTKASNCYQIAAQIQNGTEISPKFISMLELLRSRTRFLLDYPTCIIWKAEVLAEVFKPFEKVLTDGEIRTRDCKFNTNFPDLYLVN